MIDSPLDRVLKKPLTSPIARARSMVAMNRGQDSDPEAQGGQHRGADPQGRAHREIHVARTHNGREQAKGHDPRIEIWRRMLMNCSSSGRNLS